MDETAFYTCNDHSQVLSLIGSDIISCGQNGDPKECIHSNSDDFEGLQDASTMVHC